MLVFEMEKFLLRAWVAWDARGVSLEIFGMTTDEIRIR